MDRMSMPAGTQLLETIALRALAVVVDRVIVYRGQVTHLDRDLRAKLSQSPS